MATNIPSVVFNNGLKYPILGLGTWRSLSGEVIEAVKDAIDVGYRHFDCAHVYDNEKEVALGIKEKIQQGVVKREDLFITSKLWNTFHKKELVMPALKKTLADLGLDYVDLYLIHWPMGFKEGDAQLPKDDNGKTLYSDSSYLETWPAMEECVRAGLAKSIGLSNFNSKQIQDILDIATIKPVNNQVESHVYLNQQKLLDFCKSKDILLTAYSPLGAPERPSAEESSPKPLKDPKVVEIANKYNKNPGQILIKFQVQRGVIAIPKSSNKERIKSNSELFDFDISAEDMKQLESLDCNARLIHLKPYGDHKDYPFHLEF